MVNPPRRILPLPRQIPPNLTLTQTLTLTQVGIHRGGEGIDQGQFFRTPKTCIDSAESIISISRQIKIHYLHVAICTEISHLLILFCCKF